jgi:hypothetical protein
MHFNFFFKLLISSLIGQVANIVIDKLCLHNIMHKIQNLMLYCGISDRNIKTFNFQIFDALDIKNGLLHNITVWKIEKVNLVENWLWPICLFNNGNLLTNAQLRNYQVYGWNVSTKAS